MSLWLLPEPLVLASRSPVRHSIMEAAGIPVEIQPPDVNERAIEATATAAAPGEVAILLARAKALAVGSRMPARIVLGADQTLALGARRFSKPTGRSAAREQLLALRGRTHELHSAVALVRNDRVLYQTVQVARLTMRSFSDAFLDRYLRAAGDAVTTSVGAYQLERTGIHLFERIEGDYFTILGLPLLPVLAFCREEKFVS